MLFQILSLHGPCMGGVWFVGTEPHRSKRSRCAGVATTGVALQGPAECAQQEVRQRKGRAVCKRQGKQCASKDVCKGGSVQALST